jgi:hypothetical protein
MTSSRPVVDRVDEAVELPSLRSIALMSTDAMAAMTQLVEGLRVFVVDRAAAYVTTTNTCIAEHQARAAAETTIIDRRAAAETTIIDRRIAEHREINRGYELRIKMKRTLGIARRADAKRCRRPERDRDGLTDTASSTSSSEAAVDDRVDSDQIGLDNERLMESFPGEWQACLDKDDLPPADGEWRATPPTKPLRVSEIMRLQGVPARNHRKWPLWLVITASQLDGWQPKADGNPPGYTKALHGKLLRRAALAIRAMDDERLTATLG